jgi:hypothetical protein
VITFSFTCFISPSQLRTLEALAGGRQPPRGTRKQRRHTATRRLQRRGRVRPSEDDAPLDPEAELEAIRTAMLAPTTPSPWGEVVTLDSRAITPAALWRAGCGSTVAHVRWNLPVCATCEGRGCDACVDGLVPDGASAPAYALETS